MLSFGLQNIKPTLFLFPKHLNMLVDTLFFVCLLLNTLFLLFFVVSLIIASAASILLHFNLENHSGYFAFSFLTTVDVFYCLFGGF